MINPINPLIERQYIIIAVITIAAKINSKVFIIQKY